MDRCLNIITCLKGVSLFFNMNMHTDFRPNIQGVSKKLDLFPNVAFMSTKSNIIPFLRTLSLPLYTQMKGLLGREAAAAAMGAAVAMGAVAAAGAEWQQVRQRRQQVWQWQQVRRWRRRRQGIHTLRLESFIAFTT